MRDIVFLSFMEQHKVLIYFPVVIFQIHKTIFHSKSTVDRSLSFSFFKFILFLAVLGLGFCVRAFSSCSKWGLLLVAVHRLLITVASLVVEHRLQVHRLQQLWHTGSVVVACGLQSTASVVVAHRLSCSAVCGIFLDQGSNPCPLHWQTDS